MTLCLKCHKYQALSGRDVCGRCVAQDVEAGRPPEDWHELRGRMAEWGWPENAETQWVIDHGEAFNPRWKGYHVENFYVFAVREDDALIGCPEDFTDRRVGARPWVLLRWRAWKVGTPGFLEVWRDSVTLKERWALRDIEPDTPARDIKRLRRLHAIERLRGAIAKCRARAGNTAYVPNKTELQNALGMGTNPKTFYDWRRENGITSFIIDRLTGRTNP